MAAGNIAAALNIVASTLSHHLAALDHAAEIHAAFPDTYRMLANRIGLPAR